MPAPNNCTGNIAASLTSIIDCTGSKGASGQILSSTSTALQWILNAQGTVTSIATGTGLTGGPITATGTVALANTAVTAGSYTYSNFTVDAQGRLTAASSGSAPICKTEILAKGNLIVGTAAGAICALGVGTNAQILTADSACPSGVKWATAGGGSAATPTVEGVVYGCTLSSNPWNTSLGFESLLCATTGLANVSIGFNSMRLNTTGSENIAVGYCALSGNVSGLRNIAIGRDAMRVNTTGSLNIAVGQFALYCNTCSHSTAVGNGSLQYNTTGYENTSIGSQSLFRSTSGARNTSVGYQAGCTISTGWCNTVLGYAVQVPNGAGSCQLAIGFYDGCNWLTGDSTKAIKPGAGIIDCANSTGTAGQVLMSNGANAICWNTAGGSPATPFVAGVVLGCTNGFNAALGCQALQSNLSGCYNAALGTCALQGNTTGGSNTAVGSQSLRYNTSGRINIAIGVSSLYCNTTGGCNTSVGSESLQFNTTSCYNTAIGWRAASRSTGSRNTVLGSRAAILGTSGSKNIVIGDSTAIASSTGSCNVIIGADATLSTAAVNSEVTIYNGLQTARFQGSTSGWSFVSDARDKRNIENLPLGLDFIELLQPRKFEWDHRHTDDEQGKPSSGFIAQEVLEAVEANDAHYANLVDTNNPNQYTFAQANLVPILVNAIKELSAEVKILKAEVAALKPT